MKRLTPVVALAFVLSVFTLPLMAATEADPAPVNDRSPVAPIAGTITAVTGIAISPLLGTGAYGAYLYFQADEAARAQLPWFAQMSFWLPALGLVGAVALKDAAGAALPPGWKKPFDVIETLENKVSGLVAAGAVVPITMSMLSKELLHSGALASMEPINLGGVGMLQLAAIDWSWLLNVLTMPLGIAVFAVVWMASHAINGLILLSPWGGVDAALKAARTSLLGLMVVTSQLNPWLSLLLSLVVIVIAYFVAGWSFRLTVFSSVFCWDMFTARKGRFRVAPTSNKVFAGLRLGGGAPQRTYGRLVKNEAGVTEFIYKPWLVLPERRAPMPAAATLAVGRGSFFSNVNDGRGEVLVLPPRYRTHEEEMAAAYGCGRGVQPIGFSKAWGWIKGAMGFGPSASPA